MTRVVLADDQDLVRSGLELVLSARGVEVVGSAANSWEVIDLVRRVRPDVALLDIRMPVLDGIAATERIRDEAPETAVLILTTYDADRYLYAALRAGAAGFVLKTTPPDELVRAVDVVAAGEALLSPSLTRRLIGEHIRRPPPVRGVPGALAGLTERELDVFRLLAGGRSNDEIATALVVEPSTVKTHVNRIIAKLDGRTRAQLIVLAYESGFVVPGG